MIEAEWVRSFTHTGAQRPTLTGNATPLMYVIILRNDRSGIPDVRRVAPDDVESALEVNDRVLVCHDCKVRKLEPGKGGLIEAGLVTSKKF